VQDLRLFKKNHLMWICTSYAIAYQQQK